MDIFKTKKAIVSCATTTTTRQPSISSTTDMISPPKPWESSGCPVAQQQPAMGSTQVSSQPAVPPRPEALTSGVRSSSPMQGSYGTSTATGYGGMGYGSSMYNSGYGSSMYANRYSPYGGGESGF
jgi:peroxin-13